MAAVPRLTWRVVFHHRGHTHPFLGPLGGTCEGRFVVDSHGETDTFFSIHLTAEDSGRPLGETGVLQGASTVEIRPRARGSHPGGAPRP